MKERKQYEIPGITVINMHAQGDIIQTSGEELILEKLTNVTGNSSAARAVSANSNISGLFKTE